MQSEIAEHENKYVASDLITKTATLFLKQNCRSDPLYPKSIVNSIYFDTFDFKALNEKINSDFIKSKFRIRWYDNIEDHQKYRTCYAEIKEKYGARRKKKRVELPMNKDELSKMKIEDPRLLKILNYVRKKEICLVENLIPLFLIQYERHRFVDLVYNYRVCIDFNISVMKVNRTIIPDANLDGLNEAVVEVKGPTRSLPESLFFLSDLGFKKTSFSKFERCYKKIRNIVI